MLWGLPLCQSGDSAPGRKAGIWQASPLESLCLPLISLLLQSPPSTLPNYPLLGNSWLGSLGTDTGRFEAVGTPEGVLPSPTGEHRLGGWELQQRVSLLVLPWCESLGSALACLCSMHDNRWEKEEADGTLPASAGEDKAEAAPVLQVGRAACGVFLTAPQTNLGDLGGSLGSSVPGPGLKKPSPKAWSTIESKVVLRSLL